MAPLTICVKSSVEGHHIKPCLTGLRWSKLASDDVQKTYLHDQVQGRRLQFQFWYTGDVSEEPVM